MNKSTLIETLRNETGLSKSKSTQVVDLFFDQISEALTNGDRVEIRGLFAFEVRKYKGYTGRNPNTGKTVVVPPKKLPFFNCGKELKERVDYKETKTQ